MSRYGYDYSLAPGHPKGRRSLFRNVLMVGVIAAISAVSGGVVALDLLGPGSAVVNRPVAAIPQAQPVSVRVARVMTSNPAPSAPPATSAPANTGAAVEKPQAAVVTAIAQPAPPSAQPATTAAPQAAPTPNAAPIAASATVLDTKTAQVPESELTFTTGYARRRAVQAAVTTGAGTKTEFARVEEQNQIGRVAKGRAKTTVAHQNADQRRVADEQAAKFESTRHPQALALGDTRTNRRPPPQQQGGLFGGNPFGGLFRGLF